MITCDTIIPLLLYCYTSLLHYRRRTHHHLRPPPHRRLRDIPHIHLFQHFLLAEQQLCHLEGAGQLLFLQFVAQFAHLGGEGGATGELAHVHTTIRAGQAN